MKPVAMPAPLSLFVLLALLSSSANRALAQGSFRNDVVRAQNAASAPRTVWKARQPVGKPVAASSFAPHPTSRRVFGAPIQPPILGTRVVAPAQKPPND
jgi:hypothetical protein